GVGIQALTGGIQNGIDDRWCAPRTSVHFFSLQLLFLLFFTFVALALHTAFVFFTLGALPLRDGNRHAHNLIGYAVRFLLVLVSRLIHRQDCAKWTGARVIHFIGDAALDKGRPVRPPFRWSGFRLG